MNYILFFPFACIDFFLGFLTYFGIFFLFGLQQMWPDLIQKAKEGGLDVIETYVFWNGHEPEPGKVMEDYIFTQISFCSSSSSIENSSKILIHHLAVLL